MPYDKIVDSSALDGALIDIADAIRLKTDSAAPLALEDMPLAISLIEGSGGLTTMREWDFPEGMIVNSYELINLSAAEQADFYNGKLIFVFSVYDWTSLPGNGYRMMFDLFMVAPNNEYYSFALRFSTDTSTNVTVSSGRFRYEKSGRVYLALSSGYGLLPGKIRMIKI